MACGHQALDSLRWPAVTNMRANGDGGLDVPSLAYASLLQGALGLGFSKDNLRLSNCSVPPCHMAGGGNRQLQTMLAALSLGPVGLADQLFSLPKPGVDVNTNLTLARSLASSAGFLLQPSYPIGPIDPCLARAEGLSPIAGNVWATYTAVDGVPFFTAAGWSWDKASTGATEDRTPLAQYTVLPSHLTPMIDNSTGRVNGDFSAVPRDSFLGNGSAAGLLPMYVSWDEAATAAAVFDEGSGVVVRLEPVTHGQPHQINLAPVFGSFGNLATRGIALLGEKGKVAAISTYRFTSIALISEEQPRRGGSDANWSTKPTDADAYLQVTVRGEVNETVALLFATAAAGFQIQEKAVVVGPSGLATVHIP